jgi:hypothetical protein
MTDPFGRDYRQLPVLGQQTDVEHLCKQRTFDTPKRTHYNLYKHWKGVVFISKRLVVMDFSLCLTEESLQ